MSNGYVYFITNGKEIKIGYSKNNPKKRLKQLSTGSSIPLQLLGYVNGDMNEEKQLHKQFKRVNLEWFQADNDLINYINSNNKMELYVDWLDDKLIAYKMIKM